MLKGLPSARNRCQGRLRHQLEENTVCQAKKNTAQCGRRWVFDLSSNRAALTTDVTKYTSFIRGGQNCDKVRTRNVN